MPRMMMMLRPDMTPFYLSPTQTIQPFTPLVSKLVVCVRPVGANMRRVSVSIKS
jgi:hypothetical protein